MIEITADGRTQSMTAWSLETGTSLSKISSRRKRTLSGMANLTPEQWVGLEPMNEPHNKGKKYKLKKGNPMVTKSEMPMYQQVNKFLKAGLMV